MTKANLTIKNINDNNFRIGKAIRGKGTEIISADEQFIDQWGLNPTNYRYSENLTKLTEKLSKEDNLNSLYIKRIRVGCGNDGVTYHCDRGATSPYTIQELYDTKFKGIEDVCIMKRHSEVHGLISISKYTKDLESQQELMVDLFALVDTNFEIEEMDTCDYDLDITDDTLDTNGNYSNYTLVHGENSIVQNTHICEYVNGTPNNHSSCVDEDFWIGNDCTYEADLKPYLLELDPKEEVTVYRNDDEDWHVGESLFEQVLYISYFDEGYEDDDDLNEEVFYVLASNNSDKDLIEKIVEVLNSYVESFSVTSYIYNELEIGGYSDQTEFYNDGIVNNRLVELIYEDIYDLKEDIENSIPSEDFTDANIKVAFAKAYKEMMSDKMKIKDDLTVAVTPVAMRMVTDKGDETPIEYKHLKLIKKLENRFGYTLVRTSVSNNIETIAWAIKMDTEEYHFDILEVIINDINEEETLSDFIVGAVDAINKRKVAKISQAELYESASRIFVGIDDSLDSGNCSFGTEQFVLKHHIDTKSVGGIRGDALLDMELSNFTKRAVMQAIIAHGGIAC